LIQRKTGTTKTTRPEHIKTEVRAGRNFIRHGDPVKVKPMGKTQFKTGWKFLAWDEKNEVAEVRDPRTGAVRTVTLDRIQRVAVTKNGEAKQ
jgi:hypothetical protein